MPWKGSMHKNTTKDVPRKLFLPHLIHQSIKSGTSKWHWGWQQMQGQIFFYQLSYKGQHTHKFQKPHGISISYKQTWSLSSSWNMKPTWIYWWLFSASSPAVSSFPWRRCTWLQSPCEPVHFSFWFVLPPWPSRGKRQGSRGWVARPTDHSD